MTKPTWLLDPSIVMLNHGAFGACPRPVLELQARLRKRMEERPVPFLVRDMFPLLDESRRCLASLVGGRPENLVFVHNATAAVNAVVRSLRFRPGDQLLVTDHGYNACSNVVRYVARRQDAEAVVAKVPVPIQSPQEVLDAVLGCVTDRTRLAVLDHVTSPTAAVFPIQELVRRLAERGVDVLVDGAHAPGMLPLDLDQLGAAYYTGNCHKWLCAPKGSAFLYVRPDRQEGIQPPIISHGYNQPRLGYTSFQDAFDWQGTDDPTAWLCVGQAIRFVSTLVPSGLDGLMRHNRETVLAARRMLCHRLGTQPACSEEMIGSIAAVRLPDVPAATEPADPAAPVPLPRLGRILADRFSIEVPVFYWPAPRQAMLRVAAQVYNNAGQYDRLADALTELL
ncbi:MAG: aminotransferase class V-fold PLP-dependent enzyme [Phycisphaerae bacterium]|nr:aminotransferase class V-fold PLP-dependent enzyme [Phycisphaerae bacterium]